jgi:hypothetical protein
MEKDYYYLFFEFYAAMYFHAENKGRKKEGKKKMNNRKREFQCDCSKLCTGSCRE